MNNLYIIGGSTRSGKTTILKRMIMAKPMIAVQTDAIREGLRKALIGESKVTISELSFSGDVNFHRLNEALDISHKKHFSQEISQDELTWNAVFGLINYYDGQGIDLIIEGMEITPERVKSLVLKDFKIKAAFVGITDNSRLNTMLEEATHNEWIQKEIDKNANYLNEIKRAYTEEIEKSKKVAIMASEYGYKFFPSRKDDFDGYCNDIVTYLLE
jgi:2-phosphoglycerate kinase